MKVFVTGATGYIGGSVATKLLEAGHDVIGLSRSDEAAAALKKRGIEPLAGEMNQYTPIVEAAKRADAVINAANADNAFVVYALLTGLQGQRQNPDPDQRVERRRQVRSRRAERRCFRRGYSVHTAAREGDAGRD